jgi:hypothetical protein
MRDEQAVRCGGFTPSFAARSFVFRQLLEVPRELCLELRGTTLRDVDHR